MRNHVSRHGIAWAVAVSAAACTSSGYKITTQTGSMIASAGDAVALEVVNDDGSKLSSGVEPVWKAPAMVTTVSPTAVNPPDVLPTFGAAPTGVFISNPFREDGAAAIRGLLFVIDAGSNGGGTIDLTASLIATDVDEGLSVSEGLTGAAARGQATYTANCAVCHGPTADGSPAGSDGTYTINGGTYAYPAPGLNNAPNSGNLGGDPTWSAALLAYAARADADNNGVTLREPMPNWLVAQNSTGGSLTTEDFADIYAYLVSETQ